MFIFFFCEERGKSIIMFYKLFSHKSLSYCPVLHLIYVTVNCNSVFLITLLHGQKQHVKHIWKRVMVKVNLRLAQNHTLPLSPINLISLTTRHVLQMTVSLICKTVFLCPVFDDTNYCLLYCMYYIKFYKRIF